MATKEDLHRLVDELPDAELQAARRYLEYLRNMDDSQLRAIIGIPPDREAAGDEERPAEEAPRESRRE